MKEYKVEGHESSFLPEGKEWKLVWNDEFDGKELDKTKWDFRTHMMGKRHRTWIEDEGVELDGNSNVVFKCIEGAHKCRNISSGFSSEEWPDIPELPAACSLDRFLYVSSSAVI